MRPRAGAGKGFGRMGFAPERLDSPGYRSRDCSSCFSLTLMKELYHGNEEKSKESGKKTG
jgi:hypothetical protein